MIGEHSAIDDLDEIMAKARGEKVKVPVSLLQRVIDEYTKLQQAKRDTVYVHHYPGTPNPNPPRPKKAYRKRTQGQNGCSMSDHT